MGAPVQTKKAIVAEVVPDLPSAKDVIAKTSVPLKITSAPQIQHVFDDVISQAATSMDMGAMDQMLQNRIQIELKERDRNDDEKDNVIERKEKAEESEEKERKEFKEESTEKEEVQQKLAEEIEKKMPDDEEEIKDRIDNIIEVFEGTGLVEIAQKMQENIAADKIDEVHENVEEMQEVLSEKSKVVESVVERLKEAVEDGSGVGGLSESIEALSKQDKGDLQKELDEMLKGMKGLTTEDAIDRVKDFVNKHSGELNALKDIDKLLDNWDAMSPKEIKDELKDLSENIRKVTESLRKSADELQSVVSDPDDFIKKVKQFFEGDRETSDAIKRTWISSVIDFAKERLIQSDQKKDEKGKEFWKQSLGRIGEARNRSIDDFNKRLAEILKGKPKDFQEARSRADKAVIDHIESIADNLDRGHYAERLRNLADMEDKREMKSSLERMTEEMRMVSKKAEALLNRAWKGDLNGMVNELGIPTGDRGVIGRIIAKTVDKNRNKTKRDMIRQLTSELYAPMATKRIVDGMKAAQEKGDYEQIDEMAAKISQNIGKMKGISTEMSELLKMRRGPERREMIASTIASALIRPKGRKRKGK